MSFPMQVRRSETAEGLGEADELNELDELAGELVGVAVPAVADEPNELEELASEPLGIAVLVELVDASLPLAQATFLLPYQLSGSLLVQ